MEEIKCKQVATLRGGKWEKTYEESRRVYGIDGLSPTVHTQGGGNQETKILVEPLAFDEQNKYLREDGIVGTLTTDGSSPKHNNRIVEPLVIGNYHKSGHEASRIISRESIAPTIKENHGTITGVDEPIVYDGFNQQIKADSSTSGTITRNVGADLKRNGQGIIEPVIIEDFYKNRGDRYYEEECPTIRADREGLKVAEPISTRGSDIAGTIRATIHKQGERNLVENIKNGLGYEGVVEPNCAVKQGGECHTLTQAMGAGGGQIPMHNYNFRVRKLTEKECFRLQGVKDEDFAKIRQNQSKSSCYHLAGDSITTSALMALFGEMLGIDWKNSVNKLVEDLQDK